MIDPRNERRGQVTWREVREHVPKARRNPVAPRFTLIGPYGRQFGNGLATARPTHTHPGRMANKRRQLRRHNLRTGLVTPLVRDIGADNLLHIFRQDPSAQIDYSAGWEPTPFDQRPARIGGARRAEVRSTGRQMLCRLEWSMRLQEPCRRRLRLRCKLSRRRTRYSRFASPARPLFRSPPGLRDRPSCALAGSI